MTAPRLLALILGLASIVLFVPTSAQAATIAPLSLPTHAKTLILGDSYTEGVGDEKSADGIGYVPAVTSAFGWRTTRDGRGGSGYVNPGCFKVCAHIFSDRLWVPSDPASYDLIILQGSSNDARAEYSLTDLASKVNTALRVTRSRYPNARVVMVGPTNPYGNPGTDVIAVNGKLKQYAASYSVPFIDPIGERWFVPGDGARYANTTNGHPNNAGYAHYADRLITDLRRLS